MELINSIFLLLEKDGFLPAKFKPHKLTGNFKGSWECHIQPDWLLIWLLDESDKPKKVIRLLMCSQVKGFIAIP